MQSAYDFYAYWNGPQVADLWTFIAALTATDDYRSLLMSVVLFGFISVLLFSAVRNRGTDAVTWAAVTIILFSAAFLPRIAVTVKDVRAGYTQVIENVPIGIGWPASVTSRVSRWLTLAFESAFQDVDAVNYSKFGVAFPQRAVTAMLSMGPVTEKGRETLRAVVDRCVVPEVLDDPAKRAEILASADITALISSRGWLNPARRTLIDGNVLTCSDALLKLTTRLESEEIPAMEKLLAAKLDVTGEDYLTSGVLQALPGAETLMLGLSRDLSTSLKQSLMLSVIPNSLLSAASQAEKAPIALGAALARAQGNLASEINYRTLADMAKSALPKVRNILEFIVIGLFPIIFLLVAGLGLGGMPVLRSYGTLLVSVSLWAPITAVINYLAVHADAQPLNRLVDVSGGVTLMSANLIREAGASSQAMAGSLMWLVPVLAYAAAKGSDIAVTSMASSMLTPASSAAQAQGSAIATGNVSAGNASLGNHSVNNTSGNKTDMSSAYTSPDLHRNQMPEGAWQGNTATGRVTGMSVARTDIGVETSGGLSWGVSSGTTEASSSGTSFRTASQVNTVQSMTSARASQGTVSERTASSNAFSSGESTSLQEASLYASSDSVSTAAGLESSGRSADRVSSTSGLGLQAGMPRAEASPSAVSPSAAAGASTLPDGTLSAGTLPGLSPVALGVASAERPAARTLPDGLVSPRAALGINTAAEAQRAESTSSSMSAGSSTSIGRSNTAAALRTEGTMTTLADQRESSFSDTQSAALTDSAARSASSDRAEESRTGRTRNYSDQQVSTISTGLGMSPSLREAALQTYGSPQAAIEALNQSTAERMAFAQHMQTAAREEENLTDRLPREGTPSLPVPSVGNASLSDRYNADAAGIAGAASYADGNVRRASLAAEGARRTFMPATAREEEALYFNRGLIAAASADYQVSGTGMASAGARSFLFGTGYSSPAALYRDLEAKAKADPDFRAALIDLGRESSRTGSRELTPEDILSRLAR